MSLDFHLDTLLCQPRSLLCKALSKGFVVLTKKRNRYAFYYVNKLIFSPSCTLLVVFILLNNYLDKVIKSHLNK